ncbi:DUF6199 family natural product biosynthesis protein [Paenibacillus apis]|uniref:DUF6199 domain-containing protein n=1 Tax=Paenibacillus apis TaxID=1792174 RepID=A0A920CIT2_9BACL|nr:DUF6199 family natural product biosynthesis protein [Paenibacillus apis]GIO41981.1 hypothetical protein J41TS4_17390 [Paenibacillus apis]
MYVFLGLVVIGIGCLNLFFPSLGWHMKEGWKVDGDSEPSDSYLAMTRLAGLFAIFVGFIFLVTQFFS